MNRNTSLIISYTLHPLFMPSLVLFIMLAFNISLSMLLPWNMKLMLTLMSVVITMIIPFLIILLMHKLGLISSLYMDIREERAFPLLVMAVFYYLSYYLIKGIHLPMIYSMYMLGASALIIILMVWNFFMKISLHTAGMGAVTGFLAGLVIHYAVDLIPLVIIALLLSGILGAARLKLNTHQPSEIYLGWLAGAAVMFFIAFFF